MPDKPTNGNKAYLLKTAVGVLCAALLAGWGVYLRASPITQAAVEATARKVAQDVVKTQSPYLEDRKLILETLKRLDRKLDQVLRK